MPVLTLMPLTLAQHQQLCIMCRRSSCRDTGRALPRGVPSSQAHGRCIQTGMTGRLFCHKVSMQAKGNVISMPTHLHCITKAP